MGNKFYVSHNDILYAFFDDTLFTFSRSSRMGTSYFGGPVEGRVSGLESNTKKLHHIATLALQELGISHQRGWELPLLYGMQFDGCYLEYKYEYNQVDVLKLRPEEDQTEKDWPYANYPAHLPYFELEVSERQVMKWSDFAPEFINQPKEQPADVVCVVPPPGNIGMSLWGRNGDLEGVELVFEYDLEQRRVRATNRCT